MVSQLHLHVSLTEACKNLRFWSYARHAGLARLLARNLDVQRHTRTHQDSREGGGAATTWHFRIAPALHAAALENPDHCLILLGTFQGRFNGDVHHEETPGIASMSAWAVLALTRGTLIRAGYLLHFFSYAARVGLCWRLPGTGVKSIALVVRGRMIGKTQRPPTRRICCAPIDLLRELCTNSAPGLHGYTAI